MTITEAIKLMEERHLEKCINLLAVKQPKELLSFFINLKEFEQPRIQRTTFEPSTDNDVEIKITYNE